MQNISARWQINWTDVWKSVRTMLVVGAAAAVTYFLSNILPGLVAHIPASYAFIVLPLVTMGTEIARRWATDHTPSGFTY